MRGRGRKAQQRQQDAPLVKGRIQHKGNFAFLLSEKPGEQDLYLSGPSVHLAMDGDTVEARVTGRRGDRVFGEIIRVVARARATAVGILRPVGRYWALMPEGQQDDAGYEVLGFAEGLAPKQGQMASLRIERWPTEERGPGGTVTEILGNPNEPKVRRAAVLAARDIPTEFPDEALDEAAALPSDPRPEDWAGRKELFDLPVFTIDGADAKDFDDAVSLEPLENGHWRLGVHIASVADYVTRDTPIDKEAVRRGTSVYLPGKVIPMLPPKLSDNLCSLRPDVPRLTLTCWLDLSATGEPGRVKLEETVIRSCRRFTYEEIEEILEGRPVDRVTAEVHGVVIRMGALAKKLTAARMARGAIDTSAPEYAIKTDQEGNLLAVTKRPRLASHRLIEEFMVAANEAVARELSKHRVPFLRRLHDDPDPVKLQAYQEEMGKLGIKSTTSLVAHPARGIQSLLKNAVGHPFEETANIQAIRSLKMAKYSSLPGGHFGLASKDYCHFTSPIRRYPDLVVHRAVKGLLKGQPRDHVDGLDLEALAIRCSERERVAQDAERKAVDLARATLMGREIGRVFDAVVTGLAPIGNFVTLVENGASGLLRGGTMPMGTPLKAKLIAADEVLGRLEFEAVRAPTMPGQVRTSPWRGRGKPNRRGR
jgi:ribonuclease R